MKISELVNRETFRALLGDQINTYPDATPTQYLLDLYGEELSFGRIYHRVRRFVFECGLKAPANKADDKMFNHWRSDAFHLSRRAVTSLDMDNAYKSPGRAPETDLRGYLRQVRNFMAHPVTKDSTLLPFDWDQYHTHAKILRDQIEDEIDTMWVERVPNLAGLGDWFDLLEMTVELCLSVRVNDRDNRYDYELDATQEAAIVDVFTWFAICLDYTTGKG